MPALGKRRKGLSFFASLRHSLQNIAVACAAHRGLLLSHLSLSMPPVPVGKSKLSCLPEDFSMSPSPNHFVFLSSVWFFKQDNIMTWNDNVLCMGLPGKGAKHSESDHLHGSLTLRVELFNIASNLNRIVTSVTLMNRCKKIPLSHTQVRESWGLHGRALLQPVISFSVWIFHRHRWEASSSEAI